LKHFRRCRLQRQNMAIRESTPHLIANVGGRSV
jgi:hypothetical protein